MSQNNGNGHPPRPDRSGFKAIPHRAGTNEHGCHLVRKLKARAFGKSAIRSCRDLAVAMEIEDRLESNVALLKLVAALPANEVPLIQELETATGFPLAHALGRRRESRSKCPE